MRATLPLLLCATLTTSGCSSLSSASLNPFNWFGGTTTLAPETQTARAPLVPQGAGPVFDQRGGIADVAAVQFNRTPDGGILRSTGIASSQGQFNAQLVPISQENGVLTLAFRVEASASTTSGSAASRQITAARAFSNAELAGVRRIVVQGARNSRSVRP